MSIELSSGFFNAQETSSGVWDRVYDAEDFSGLFDGLFSGGIFSDFGTAFNVQAIENTDLNTKPKIVVDTGKGWLNNVWFKLTGPKTIELDNRGDGARLDTLYLEINKNNRDVYLKVQTGTTTSDFKLKTDGGFSSSNYETIAHPTIPSGSNNVFIYPIAYVLVANSTYVGGNDSVPIKIIGTIKAISFENTLTEMYRDETTNPSTNKPYVSGAVHGFLGYIIELEKYNNAHPNTVPITPYASMPDNFSEFVYEKLKNHFQEHLIDVTAQFQEQFENDRDEWESYFMNIKSQIEGDGDEPSFLNHIGNHNNPHEVTATQLDINTIYLTINIPENSFVDNNGIFKYQASNLDIAETDYITVDLDPDMQDASLAERQIAAYASLYNIELGNGSITIYAFEQPDVPISLKLGGVHIGT